MGDLLNDDVKVTFEGFSKAVVSSLQYRNDSSFVMAYTEDPKVSCRMSFAVIGPDEETVRGYLLDRADSRIAPGPVSHLLQDMKRIYQVGRAATDPSVRTALGDLVPQGCCTCSSGVSVLAVNQDGTQFREILLADKYVVCTFNGDKISTLNVSDSEPGDRDRKYPPCDDLAPGTGCRDQK
jgi:hypothetical protein